MNDRESVINELLDVWEEHRERGDSISIVELCARHTELVDEVRARIAALLVVDDVASLHEPHFPLAPTSIGPYRVIREIGSGAASTVYLAEQSTPHRQVAIKLFQARGTQREKRFKREAHILGRLDHPGIAKVFDFGRTEDQCPYLVMEFIDGTPLDEVLATKPNRLETLRLLLSILESTEYAHRQNVIHRDLKPANILVDQSGLPKLIDFGIAKLTTTSVDSLTTQADLQQMLGTLPYMAPEQIDNDSVDFRADIYAIGVIAYQMFAGQLPIPTENLTLHKAILEIREHSPALLTSVAPECSKDVEAVIHKAIQKLPADRYASAKEFAADTQRLLDRHPVHARRVTPWRIAASYFQRHPRVIPGVLLFFVTSWLIATSFLDQSQDLKRAQGQAQAERDEKESIVLKQKALEATLEKNRYARTLQQVAHMLPHETAEAKRILVASGQCPPALRGAAWKFLSAAIERSSWTQQYSLIPHSICYHSETGNAYVGARNGTVTRVGRNEPGYDLKRHSSAAILCFYLDAASQELFAGNRRGGVASWRLDEPDAAPRAWLPDSLDGIDDMVRLVALTHKQELLVVTRQGRVIRIDRETQEILEDFRLGIPVFRARYHAARDLLATIEGDRERVSLYELKSRKRRDVTPPAIAHRMCLCFLNDGSQLVVADGSLGLHLYSTDTGQKLEMIATETPCSIIEASASGNRLVWKGTSRRLFEAEASNLPFYKGLTPQGYGRHTRAIDLAEDGRGMAIATYRGHVGWYNMQPLAADFQSRYDPPQNVSRLEPTAAGVYLSTNPGNQLYFHDHVKPHLVWSGDSPLRLLQSDRDDSQLLACTRNRLYCFRNKKLVSEYQTGNAKINDVLMWNDENVLVAVGGRLNLMDFATGETRRIAALPASILRIACDETHVVTCDSDGGVHRLRRNLDLNALDPPVRLNNIESRAQAISLHRSTLRIWGDALKLSTIDVRTGNMRQGKLESAARPTTAAFSPDGNSLVAASEDHELHFYDCDSGRLKLRIPNAFSARVNRIWYSADQRELLATDESGSLYRWILAVGE